MKNLRTQDLVIGYTQKELSLPLNLSLNAGDFIGLIGQNGVGKSTLIRTLSGFQAPLNGRIFLEDQNTESMNRESFARKMAVVLTEKPMAQNLTVIELISLGRHPHSNWLGQLKQRDIEAVEKALTQTQTEYLAKKRLYELSDGQMQKVMIARALAQECDTILLDEPTSHLDARNKQEVMYLLRDISASGKAILISTHEIHLAEKTCSLFWGMGFQSDIEVGKPSEMKKLGQLNKILHVEGEIF